MLNLDLIDALYAGLPKTKQQELISLLFKRSKQTMNYFHRTKDISLSKFETLADYFHMSLDSLRVGGSANNTYVPGDNNTVSCNFVNSDVYNQKIALEKEVAGLKETIKAKDEAIKAMTDLIEALKKQAS